MSNNVNRLLVAGAFIIRDGKLLLALKKSTNQYSLIGGKVELGEAIHQALIREIYEEAGLNVKEEDMQLVHVVSFKREDNDEITFIDFMIKKFEGEPINKEPLVHVSLDWFPLEALPENLPERRKKTLQLYDQQVYYSHYGW